MKNALYVLQSSARISIRELALTYPPVVYFGAWIPRVLTQLAFFALLVEHAGGKEWLDYALVGNAVYLVALTCISYISGSVVVERHQGTLPLIAASPANPLLVLAGRNIGLALHAYVTGLLSLAVALIVSGPYSIWSVATAPLILFSSAFSAYLVGLLIGAFALRGQNLHNLFSNGTLLLILAVSGVNVPVSALPGWLAQVAAFLPVTHGLAAMRLGLSGAPVGAIFQEALLEVAVGSVFALIALLFFHLLFQRARRDGSLSLS